jgi:SAM-dependent methyltransferase
MIQLKNGMKVLDVGCGNGKTTIELFQKKSQSIIEAIDVSPSMVEVAIQNRSLAIHQGGHDCYRALHTLVRKGIEALDLQMYYQIWEILCECDQDFFPPLSSRESSYQNELSLEMKQDVKPYKYFNEMIGQFFIVALEPTTDRVVGFMTFKHSYSCPELSEYDPSNYITTICVRKHNRNQGITKKLYDFIEECLPSTYRLPYVTTRTWTGNDAHIQH